MPERPWIGVTTFIECLVSVSERSWLWRASMWAAVSRCPMLNIVDSPESLVWVAFVRSDTKASRVPAFWPRQISDLFGAEAGKIGVTAVFSGTPRNL